MENLKQHHTLLNRLLLAQMYRTEAYRKASETATEPDFKGFFAENTRMGEMLIEEITETLNLLYVSEAEDTAIPTQYQRVWTMLPDVMVGTGKNDVLDNYVTGESLTIRLYNEALQNAASLPMNIREMLLRQRMMLLRVVNKARHLKVSKLQVFFRRVSQIKRLFFHRIVLFP